MNSELIRNEVVIDWKNIFWSVVKKWWLILLFLILGMGLGYGLGVKADVPVYESRAVYVLSYSGGSGTVSSMSSEYSFLTRIQYNCTEVLRQNTFTNLIASDINAGVDENSPEYIAPEVLQKCISYTFATQGTLIYITVRTGDAELSHRIVSSVTDHLADHIKSQYKLAGIDSMVFSLVNTPEEPEEPVESRTRVMFTAIGAVSLAAICIVILAFTALLDTRIKKEDDLKNRFNVPVLGTIPNFYDPEIYKGGYYHYGAHSNSK